MNNKEYISFEQVRDGVNSIIRCSKTMDTIFDAVTGKMNYMTSDEVFQGRSKEALMQAFAPFQGQFKNYVAKVQEFADAFSQASTELEDTEHRIETQANELGN